MSKLEQIRELRTTLEVRRLEATEVMAAVGAPSWEALRELATLQSALMAVREVVEEQGVGIGWAGGEEKSDPEVLELERKNSH